METQLISHEETRAIRGAVFEVYRQIGCGFLESVYQDCLEREFTLRGIPFEAQKKLHLYYKEEMIKPEFIADFVCYGKIIVEIKAISDTFAVHKAQVFNYLRMSRLKLGLLVNFGHYPGATVERVLNSETGVLDYDEI